MLTILGPAKTINTHPHEITRKHTMPAFLEDANDLVNILRTYSIDELKKLMKISQSLAELNVERIASWRKVYTENESIQSILAFSGEVFNGLDARTLKEDDLLFAQEHVRLLSGLYGVLRPLDLILPYRLEIGTRLSNPRGKDLYAFWEERIPETIAALTKSSGGVLINLASNEYFTSIRPKVFPHRVITPVFKESDGNGYRNVTIYAKKARGLMLRFIITQRIDSVENIKAFDEDGYYFNPEMSGENEWWFTR